MQRAAVDPTPPTPNPVSPVIHPPMGGMERRGQLRRRLLWTAMVALLLGLVGTAIVLARRFQESHIQQQLLQETATLVSDIRTGLNRNIQTLQALHDLNASPGAWSAPALEILEQNREMVQLEWRDSAMRVLASRTSPFHANNSLHRHRVERAQDVTSTCAHARRTSAPAYSSSYFLPDGEGHGLELIEMCMPQAPHGDVSSYLVVTYTLHGMLTELLERTAIRGRGVALTEVDGTRLAIIGSRPAGPAWVTEQLLELPGTVMMLRLESPKARFDIASSGVTSLVAALSVLLLGVVSLLGRDMRRRVRVEKQLAEALTFRTAMENSLVTGLRARDLQGRITYVNPAFCQMVDRSANELLGASMPFPYWPPEMVDEYQRRQAIRLAGQTLPREGYESMFMRRDGTRFPVLIIEAPLLNAQGTQTGWMSAILDLTEQRRMEALSRASEDRLQATARLATVGEMASLLSHELNQPLSAISSYATGSLNLLDAETTAHPDPTSVREVAEALVRIQTQADRAARVIRSVGDFVRRRDRQQELVREQVAVDSLLAAILPLVGLQARRENIQLAVDVPTDCPPALCDRTMVEQVLLNLARNGMQAMPQGQPSGPSGLRVLSLAVRPTAVQDGRAWLMFSVTDHGSGLPDDVASKLFTPFFTTKAEGMGLGLSLCRTVVEQHGGQLTHEPAQPCGTVFRFTLPAASETRAAHP